ncbi:hypothetical protein [Sphingomonas sp. 22R3R2A-7]|uniref:hypothetical protein n=1 Tax=Sphingomonas sp. 22R3R2A-7 TaxID=3050230 RepID=UPI002FDF1AF7
MLSLRNTASILRAIQPPQEARLRSILDQRIIQLTEDGGRDIANFAHFLIVQAGDDDQSVKAELGFSILENLVDGARYGDLDFEPSWEWIMRHEGWFELVYVLSDDGFGWVVFVQDDDAVDADLLGVCREYAPAI